MLYTSTSFVLIKRMACVQLCPLHLYDLEIENAFVGVKKSRMRRISHYKCEAFTTIFWQCLLPSFTQCTNNFSHLPKLNTPQPNLGPHICSLCYCTWYDLKMQYLWVTLAFTSNHNHPCLLWKVNMSNFVILCFEDHTSFKLKYVYLHQHRRLTCNILSRFHRSCFYPHQNIKISSWLSLFSLACNHFLSST